MNKVIFDWFMITVVSNLRRKRVRVTSSIDGINKKTCVEGQEKSSIEGSFSRKINPACGRAYDETVARVTSGISEIFDS